MRAQHHDPVALHRENVPSTHRVGRFVGLVGSVEEETILPSAEVQPCFPLVVEVGVMEMLITPRAPQLSPYGHRPTEVIIGKMFLGTRKVRK